MAKKFMNVYKCEDVVWIDHNPYGRLNVKLLQNHKGMGGLKGERCITSKVQHIDMAKGYAVTKNSIYVWKV